MLRDNRMGSSMIGVFSVPFPISLIIVKTTQNLAVPFVLFLLRLDKLKRRQHAKIQIVRETANICHSSDSLLPGRSLVCTAFHTKETK